MDETKLAAWINHALIKHHRLASSAKGVIENLLKTEQVEYLALTSRVKDSKGIQEKIKRKKYTNPEEQLTDISGIRIIVFLNLK